MPSLVLLAPLTVLWTTVTLPLAVLMSATGLSVNEQAVTLRVA
jgi:hypothetical protein